MKNLSYTIYKENNNKSDKHFFLNLIIKYAIKINRHLDCLFQSQVLATEKFTKVHEI